MPKKIDSILYYIFLVGSCIVTYVQNTQGDMGKYAKAGATPYFKKAHEYARAGNYSQAIPYLKKVNELVGGNDSECQFVIGAFYKLTVNHTQAVYWWRNAAEQGWTDARYKLGNAYHNGQGVTKDDAQAASWWRKAAQQGLGNAQGHLSLCYYRGDGVAKDLGQAKFWARKAIENKDTSSEMRQLLQEQVLQEDTTLP